MKLTYLKSALKCDSFDVAIGIKIPLFRVLVTIEPGRSLLHSSLPRTVRTKLKDARTNFREGSFDWKLKVVVGFFRVKRDRRATRPPPHRALFPKKHPIKFLDNHFVNNNSKNQIIKLWGQHRPPGPGGRLCKLSPAEIYGSCRRDKL